MQTSSSNTLTYLLTDHLNSTSTTLDSDGDVTAWLRYDAWGVTRSSSGSTPTGKRYTGQYQAEAGLYFYNARWYDPETGRFAQADTIIPEAGDPLAWDRYAYVNNNPLSYSDPSGHCSLSSSSLLTPFGFLAFYGSCVQDIKDTYNAYQAGERNLGALYMEATGIKDSVVSLATDVHTLNQDFSTVFSDAPFIDRIGPSVHVGSFAVGTAATLIGIIQGAQALTRNRNTSMNSIDELLGFSEKSNRSNTVWENNLTKDDALDYFYRIADTDTVIPHRNIKLRLEGGLEGNIQGIDNSYIGFRPFSSTKPYGPTLDIHRVPGLPKLTEIKFLGSIKMH